jgi:hypothetical protein
MRSWSVRTIMLLSFFFARACGGLRDGLRLSVWWQVAVLFFLLAQGGETRERGWSERERWAMEG